MAFEIATVLLGVGVGAALVLYAAPKGFFGHPRKKGPGTAPTTGTTHTTTAEQAEPTVTVAPAAPKPAPSPAPAIYETVQPNPASVPVQSSNVTTFGASTASIAQRTTKTYRRRAAPNRAAKPSTKPKKR